MLVLVKTKMFVSRLSVDSFLNCAGLTWSSADTDPAESGSAGNEEMHLEAGSAKRRRHIECSVVRHFVNTQS
jgi:hypothetical protein